MKRIARLILLLALACSVIGITSCSVFDESTHSQSHATMKHTKPLPKKYIINNGYKPIVK